MAMNSGLRKLSSYLLKGFVTCFAVLLVVSIIPSKATFASTLPFQYHLLHSDKIVHASTLPFQRNESVHRLSVSLHVTPQADVECLGVALTVTNPAAQQINIVMGINNLCGATVSGVDWIYTTTDICNGQAFQGPSNSGNVGSMRSGQFLTVANDAWFAECIDPSDGFPTTFQSSTTGTANGTFGGNIAFGSRTTPEQTFF